MKFELGKVVMTVGANAKLECTSVAEILLGRYVNVTGEIYPMMINRKMRLL